MSGIARLLGGGTLLLALFGWSSAGAADNCSLAPIAKAALPPSCLAFEHAIPVSSVALDSVRGGVSTADGLQMSLGIERVVSINGEETARSNVRFSAIGAPGNSRVAAAGTALSGIKVLQLGEANVMLAELSPQLAGGLIIQNSLNGQHIQSQTIITASVNSMDLLKALNFQGSLGDALARAAAVR